MKGLLVWTYHITRVDWLFLLMGVFLLSIAYRGLATGKSVLIYQDVTRSEDGFRYWLAICLELAAGAITLFLLFWRRTDHVFRDDWVLLVVGVGLVAFSMRGLVTGKTVLFYSEVRRSEPGSNYWLAICLGFVLGIAALAILFWRLFTSGAP